MKGSARSTVDAWRIAVAALGVAATALCGCEPATPQAHVMERDTIGDTVVVRTVSGGAWGGAKRLAPEMRIGALRGEEPYMLGQVRGLAVDGSGAVYAYDEHVPILRKFSPEGTFVSAFGRAGGGPGEYGGSDGGLGVLPDGRVLLRDPGRGRINLYSEEGEYLDSWQVPGNYYSGRPIYVDTAGRAHTQVWDMEGGTLVTGLRRYSRAGEPEGRLVAPDRGRDGGEVSVVWGDGRRMATEVPFWPSEHWTFSPHGYLIAGRSERYAIDLFLPGGTVRRLERASEPVAVAPDERAALRTRIEEDYRRRVPSWTWDGPEIPTVKPVFKGIYVGRDGRIWVHRHSPSTRRESLAGPDEWKEPVVFDVFEPGGTYLGEVTAPDGFRTTPEPVFGRDHVWAVVVDAMDVQYVTRFRIAAR